MKLCPENRQSRKYSSDMVAWNISFCTVQRFEKKAWNGVYRIIYWVVQDLETNEICKLYKAMISICSLLVVGEEHNEKLSIGKRTIPHSLYLYGCFHSDRPRTNFVLEQVWRSSSWNCENLNPFPSREKSGIHHSSHASNPRIKMAHHSWRCIVRFSKGRIKRVNIQTPNPSIIFYNVEASRRRHSISWWESISPQANVLFENSHTCRLLISTSCSL